MTLTPQKIKYGLVGLLALLTVVLLYLLLPGRHALVWSIVALFGFIVWVYLVVHSLIERSLKTGAQTRYDTEKTLADLNVRVQSLLSIDNVMEALNTYLARAVPVCNLRYFLSVEFLPGQYDQSGLYAWGDAERWMAGRLWQIFSSCRDIQRRGQTDRRLQEFFDSSDTDVAVPLFYHGHLLGVIVLGCDRNEAHTEDQEKALFQYLTQRLPQVLDRIRIYNKVWQSKEVAHTDKLQAMRSLGANIAHEMRTPLSGIRASMSGLENYLPILIDTYQLARTVGQQTREISPAHLDNLMSTPSRISLMIDQANAVIDLLLMNLRESEEVSLERCDAASCIRNAVDRYPFRTGEREKVSLNLDQDFDFMGVEILFTYIIFNLLKNSLYSIRSAQKGEISITLEKEERENSILVEDGGLGIPESVLGRIFDSFFTTKEEGTGAGLTFCRNSMLMFGGDISCESVAGEYSRFRLVFPSGDMTQPE